MNTVNEQNFEYLSNQLKYIGFGETLRPALKDAMENATKVGEKQFALAYVPDFDKERTAVTLQFKQSESSDRFFFNRFNVAVKNEQFPDGVKQGFTVPPFDRREENITLKMGYNLTDGRPALVVKQDANKEAFSAWAQLDFNKQKQNGDFEMRLFNKNYGFDLEKVLVNYPIKELDTPAYKESLIQSLQRGNLQSVTFKNSNEEQKLFISPDIKLAALKVYDQDKQRVPLQYLVDKQFIGKDLSDRLTQQIANLREKMQSPNLDGRQKELLSNYLKEPSSKQDIKLSSEQVQKPSQHLRPRNRLT